MNCQNKELHKEIHLFIIKHPSAQSYHFLAPQETRDMY